MCLALCSFHTPHFSTDLWGPLWCYWGLGTCSETAASPEILLPALSWCGPYCSCRWTLWTGPDLTWGPPWRCTPGKKRGDYVVFHSELTTPTLVRGILVSTSGQLRTRQRAKFNLTAETCWTQTAHAVLGHLAVLKVVKRRGLTLKAWLTAESSMGQSILPFTLTVPTKKSFCLTSCQRESEANRWDVWRRFGKPRLVGRIEARWRTSNALTSLKTCKSATQITTRTRCSSLWEERLRESAKKTSAEERKTKRKYLWHKLKKKYVILQGYCFYISHFLCKLVNCEGKTKQAEGRRRMGTWPYKHKECTIF